MSWWSLRPQRKSCTPGLPNGSWNSENSRAASPAHPQACQIAVDHHPQEEAAQIVGVAVCVAPGRQGCVWVVLPYIHTYTSLIMLSCSPLLCCMMHPAEHNRCCWCGLSMWHGHSVWLELHSHSMPHCSTHGVADVHGASFRCLTAWEVPCSVCTKVQRLRCVCVFSAHLKCAAVQVHGQPMLPSRLTAPQAVARRAAVRPCRWCDWEAEACEAG